MSLLGYVFNRAANKQIPVYLMTHGPGFWRPTGVISDEVKDLALSKIKNAFEGGHLFKENDMKSMERLDIRCVLAEVLPCKAGRHELYHSVC